MGISTAIDESQIARAVGIETKFEPGRGGAIFFLPQRIAIVGQGATGVVFASTKRQIISAFEAGTVYGFGSPIHLAALQLLPLNGDGVGSIPVTVYPLGDGGSAVAATGSVTAIGTATKPGSFKIKINNILSLAFTVAVGEAGTAMEERMTIAINSIPEMPVTAANDAAANQTDLTSKWQGLSANDVFIEVDGPTDTGITFTIVQPSGGLVNPDIDPALLLVGNVWETLFLNCLDVADTATLGKFDVFGEGRWGSLVRKPMIAFVGNTIVGVGSATVVADARKSDRTNAQLVAPGSKDLPFVVAARQLARIAKTSNNNPPQDYGSQKATGLTPGLDSEQWTNLERDTAIKAGSSSVIVRDGVVNIGDVVTFYHPTGDPTPAYRYVVDIIKLMQVLFNLDLIFLDPQWDGAPLLNDGEPTTNKSAKHPKDAKAAVAGMMDSLGLNAILTDVVTSKPLIQAQISATNPKRLDLVVPVKLSGNTNIISIDVLFGFNFGEG